jgi:hypothetical protein
LNAKLRKAAIAAFVAAAMISPALAADIGGGTGGEAGPAALDAKDMKGLIAATSEAQSLPYLSPTRNAKSVQVPIASSEPLPSEAAVQAAAR